MANIDTLRYKNTDYTLGKVPDKTLSISDTPADAKAVGDALANQLTAYPNISTSGSIAHFEDGADSIPMKDVLVHVNPVQDLHGYDSPWPAGGGVNQWDEDWENGYYNRATGAKDGDSNTTYFRSKNYIPCAPNTSYYFRSPSVHASNDTYYAVLFYDADKNYISAINSGVGNAARTTPQNAQFMTFYIEVGTSDATYHNDIAINYPATVTTYSPYSNICPITGWTGAKVTRTGKNLLNPDIKIYINDNMCFGAHSQVIVPDGTFILPAGTYTASASDTMTAIYVHDSSGSCLGVIYNNTKITFTNPKTQPVLIRFYKANTTEQGFSGINMCGESGSTATDYEPYSGSTYTLTFPTEAGTVYGGTLDVTSGVLTVDRAMLYAKDINFTETPIALNDGTGYYIYGGLVFPIESKNKISNIYKSSIIANAWKDRTFGEFQTDTKALIITLPPEADTLAKAKQWIIDNDPYFVYELATPKTYQLTPQEITSLLGTNNLWANTGDSEVEYRADTKVYVDAKVAAAESNITDLQNSKVDKTTPLLNFDDTATDPLTDDGALANALTALGILSDVIPSGGGSLYLKKALTEILEKIDDATAYSSGTLTNTLPSNIDLQTGTWTKYGHIATVTVVFKVTTSDITAGLQQIASGAPKPKNGNYEFIGMSVSGTFVPRRFAVTTGGGVYTWYSGTFSAGQTYMATAVYICE